MHYDWNDIVHGTCNESIQNMFPKTLSDGIYKSSIFIDACAATRRIYTTCYDGGGGGGGGRQTKELWLANNIRFGN